MKTKLPPGPIRPSGNYYLLNCVPFKKKKSYRGSFQQTLVRKTWSRWFTRGQEILYRRISSLSLYGASVAVIASCRGRLPNISVCVMTRQFLTADGEGATVASLHPQLMEVTVMWRRQVTGANWQLYLVAVVSGGRLLKLRVVGWSSAWPEGDGHSYIFNVCLRVLTQLLVTAHPTCHGTEPTGPSNRPSFLHTSII